MTDASEAAVTSGSSPSGAPRVPSPRPGDRRTTGTFPDRGHKTDYLFRPLPEPSEVADVGVAAKVD